MPVNGGQAGVRYGNVDHSSYVGGNDTHFPAIFNWPVVEGSYFSEADEQSVAAVAVIGYKVRQKLFGEHTDPIGQYILIENVPFQVVGVLEEKVPLPVTWTATTASPFPTRRPASVCLARRTPSTSPSLRVMPTTSNTPKKQYATCCNACITASRITS